MKSEQPKNLLYSILRISFVLLVAVLLTAPASAQEAAQPSREKFIDTLRTIAKQLEAKKYAETEKYFYLPEQFEHKMFGRLVEAKMISSQGVEALDLGGDYGAADGILRKSDAEEYAARGSLRKLSIGRERNNWADFEKRSAKASGIGSEHDHEIE